MPGVAALGLALALLLVLPLSSFGAGSDPVGDTVRGLLTAVPRVTHAVQTTVQDLVAPTSAGSSAPVSHSAPAASGSSASSASPPATASGTAPSGGRAATGSPNTPAMYGTNPHGQGTVAGVSLSPSTNLPYTWSPSGSGGEITVVGRGRSEQNGSDYHAHTTTPALLGQEILGVDATPGQSKTGPLDAVQTGILDKVCSGSGQLACLTVLAADTSATSSGANTHFSLAHATVAGANGIDVGVAEANSAISTVGSCQSASGNGSVAGVNIAGGPAASVAKSSESSTACGTQTAAQTPSSSVVGLAGTGLPLPAPGCDNGTPNTTLSVAGLLTLICNAESTTQAVAPAGVREALTAIVLPAVGTALVKTVTAASESHAVAPSSSNNGGGNNGGNNGGANNHNGGGNNNGGNGGNGGKVNGQHTQTCAAGNEEGACEGTGTSNCSASNDEGSCEGAGENEARRVLAARVGGELPFTGEDVLKVLLVGLLLAGGGLALGAGTRARNG